MSVDIETVSDTQVPEGAQTVLCPYCMGNMYCDRVEQKLINDRPHAVLHFVCKECDLCNELIFSPSRRYGCLMQWRTRTIVTASTPECEFTSEDCKHKEYYCSLHPTQNGLTA